MSWYEFIHPSLIRSLDRIELLEKNKHCLKETGLLNVE